MYNIDSQNFNSEWHSSIFYFLKLFIKNKKSFLTINVLQCCRFLEEKKELNISRINFFEK